MADEVTTNTQEIENADDDSRWIAEAMKALESEDTGAEQQKEEVIENVEDQSKVEEPTEEKKEEAEPAETPQAEVRAEETKPEPDTEKPEAKPLYTPEEIESEMRVHGDLARLDSSRLSPEGKLIQASMQRGLTPKLQRAAEIEKNYQAILQKEREAAEIRAKEEAERKFREETEQYGEEIAMTRKEMREARAEIEKIKAEREQERQIFQAEQQKVAAQQFHLTFIEKAKDYGIPNNAEFEELVMSRVLAENQTRALDNRPFISVEDGMRLVSDTIGVKDVDGLDKLLAANPKLMEALENRFKEKYSKAKSSGPTVIKSSSGGGGKSEVKPAAAADKELFEQDPDKFALDYAMSLIDNPK
jgi:hypothetical protein